MENIDESQNQGPIPIFQVRTGHAHLQWNVFYDLWKAHERNYRDKFVQFLNEFKRVGKDDELPFYQSYCLKRLKEAHTVFEVDLAHVKEWDMSQSEWLGLKEFLKLNALCLLEENLLHEVGMQLIRISILHTSDEEQEQWLLFLRENSKLVNISLVDLRNENPLTLREIYCHKASQLMTITGTVTRTSDVRPELRSAYFSCDICNEMNGPVIQHFKFTEPLICSKSDCKNKRRWTRIDENSEYGDWQKVRLQENANEIPAGCLPRSMDIILRAHLVNQCKAGDKITASGSLAVVPDVTSVMARGEIPKLVLRDFATANRQEMNPNTNLSGVKGLGVRDLGSKPIFMVNGITVNNQSKDRDTPFDEDDPDAHLLRGVDSILFRSFRPMHRNFFREIANNRICMDILVKPFLPGVYGNWNIKKGILLMLAGGVEKTGEKDAMKLRGDININIIGDPGTAKSSILREVNKFVPRSVYASGKMATAAGLTASVMRDRDQSGAPVIEAGALMLADGGICCIDEFDKMDPKDMSAIHEAMEQQTISISKAGVQATLNARASVLAACSPLHGRYDASKSFRQNVNLTAPILSRFDLMFVIMDDTTLDSQVSAHILGIDPDQLNTNNENDEERISLNLKKLELYLTVAKTLKPKLTSAAAKHLERCYVVLRQQDVIPGAQKSSRMTVRQLESLVRLSEAAAKLHLSDEVLIRHVEIAFELFQNSLTKISKGTIDFLADDEPQEGEQVIKSIEKSQYSSCANFIVSHFQTLIRENMFKGDHSSVDILEDDLTDILVLNKFPEGDESELAENYSLAGKIINQMIEVDMTLVACSFLDEDNVRTRLLSLHPSLHVTTDEYTDQETNRRAERARRGARGAIVAQEPQADGDIGMDDSQFDEYLNLMGNN